MRSIKNVVGLLLAAMVVAEMMVAGLTAPVLAGDPAARANWGTEPSKSKAICRALGAPVAPPDDRPSPAETVALHDCRSEPLYYGEGQAPDYVAARSCAFVELEGGDVWTFGGSTILMQVYANGLGVARNLNLAMAYACQLQAAPAETDGRVLHLQALKSSLTTKVAPFDYCDDVTSGWAGSECTARASTLASFARDSKLAALEARIPDAARPSYDELNEALREFIEVHADGEVDQAGSGRAGFVIEEQDAMRDQFTRDLERLLTGTWPDASATAARDADAHLNTSYRKTLAWADSAGNMSTIHSGAIRKTQRAWIVYRDAFIRFAAAASPRLSRDAVLAYLTQLRNIQLERMPV